MAANEIFTHKLAQHGRYGDGQRDGDQRNEGQFPAVIYHHTESTDDGNDARNQRRDGLRNGIGHVFYVLFMSFLSGKNVLVEALIAGAFAIVFTLAVVFFSKQLLGLKLGKFVIQAGSYACMLSFAAAFAVALAVSNPALWPFAIALVAFWLSDIVLSIMYFGGKSESKFLSILNHVLYYGAQIAIALFVLTL